MKKLFIASLLVLAGALFAETINNNVEIGVTAITSSLKNNIVAIPYADLGTGGDIKVANIVKTTNLTENDMLVVFNNGAYSAWSLNASKAWEPCIVASLGGVALSAGAADATITTGKAIWLVRAATPSSSFTFYVYGAAPAANPTTTIAAGHNLVANPLRTTATFTFANASIGDTVLVPSDDAKPRLYKKGAATGDAAASDGWSYTVESSTPGQLPSIVYEKPAAAAGCGFWYSAKTAGTMSWTTP